MSVSFTIADEKSVSLPMMAGCCHVTSHEQSMSLQITAAVLYHQVAMR